MREICLHLLDLAQNAAAAVAGRPDARVAVSLIWDERPDGGQTRAEQPDGAPTPRLTLCVTDNGCGMTAEQAGQAQSPFYTTRAKRGAGPGRGAASERGADPERGADLGIGLGIPLCKAAALRTGGTFSLESASGRGTRVTAVFCPGHIDCAPLGDLHETLAAIVGGSSEIAFTVSAQVLSAADGTPRTVQDTAEDTAEGAAEGGTEDAANNAAEEAAKAAFQNAVQATTFRAGPDTLRALTQGFPPGDARAIPRLKQYFTENLSSFLQKGEHGMKSLEELAAIRDKMKQTVETREAAHDATRITVGMGTTGIAAGARSVLNAFAEEVTKSGLHGVLVTQSGSIGLAGFEPVVEVERAGAEKVTYVKMTPEKAARVVAEHLANGAPVAEYTIENAQ